MSISGFDELGKKLTQLSNNAQKLAEKERSIPLAELLTQEFVVECSKFSSLDDMFESSGLTIQSSQDFSEIRSDQLNDFIKTNTSYENWDEMLGAAAQKWTVKKLGLAFSKYRMDSCSVPGAATRAADALAVQFSGDPPQRMPFRL